MTTAPKTPPLSVYRQWLQVARRKLHAAARAERARDPLAANFARDGAAYAFRQAAKHCRGIDL